jgi:PAS domain S-box-containing protein
MSAPGTSSWRTSALWNYGLAVLSVAIALALGLLMEQLGARDGKVSVFLIAIALTSWYANVRAAALALLLSTIVYDYFFVEPLFTLSVARVDILYLTVFAAFGSLVVWFSTVRRRAESELRQARDELQSEVAERTQQANLLNLTHDTIFVRDMNDFITYWNLGAQELYGWKPEEAIGKCAHELLQTVFPIPLEAIHAELLRSGRWDGELEKARADGSRITVSSRWSLQRDEHGRPAAILATNNDITDRKKREQEVNALNEELRRRTVELEASNKELEAFAYSISHDLRAPLRHMVGFTELLQKSTAALLNEKSRRYVIMVLDSAKRMGNLIDDLLAFSRIGRAQTQKTLVSLDQLVQEVLSELRHDTNGRNIVWKVDALPECYGDRSMLRLALVNLVSNAVKFTGARLQAEIEIGCEDQGRDEVVVFVRDNGVGFDMKYANKLFGVFQRLHSAEAFEGTGIGLATVQRIIRRHGGEVWAKGLVDNGATFYFSLSKCREANS